MPNQKTNETSILIPKVRYHPSIQTRTPPAQVQTPKSRSTHSKRTQQGGEGGNNNTEVDLAPDVRLIPNVGQKQSNQKPANRPNQKLEKRTDPDPPQKGLPEPEQFPLSLEVQLNRCVVEQVEVLTRGQRTNQDWFSWRKNRITASVVHRIAHCRFVNGNSKTLPHSYLAEITGEGSKVQTRAMSWGVQMEAEVISKYQRLKSSALGHSVSVQDCGLFIDARRPWLAASPDGIVIDSKTGQWLLCLEVKCPYKHKERRVEDACRDDPSFCLQIQEEQDGRKPEKPPVYRLKNSHSYFSQIQCQLAVTGLHQADLVVFTLKETAIVPVTFDPDLWEETVSRLEVFYRDALLPHIREKTGQQTSAVCMPEL